MKSRMRRTACGQRVRRVLDAPRLDADGLHRAAIPPLAVDDAAREPRELTAARQRRGTYGGVRERWRDGNLLRSLGGTHEHPHAPSSRIVGRGEHAEAAALPRAETGSPGERHLRGGDREQQCDGNRRAGNFSTTTGRRGPPRRSTTARVTAGGGEPRADEFPDGPRPSRPCRRTRLSRSRPPVLLV